MTPLMLFAGPVIPAINQATAAAASVFASVTTGIALGGAVVGIFAGLATILTLVIFAVVTVRKGRNDHEQELRDAEDRGKQSAKAELQPWLDYYRDLAQGKLRMPPAVPGRDEDA